MPNIHQVRRVLLRAPAVVVAAAPVTIFIPSAPQNVDDSTWNGGTLRTLCTITAGSNGRVRATFIAGTSGLVAARCSIGLWTGAAAVASTTSTPVELLFSGGSGFSIGASATITSDFSTLNFTSSDRLVVIIDPTSGNVFEKTSGVANASASFNTSPSYNTTADVGTFLSGAVGPVTLIETSV